MPGLLGLSFVLADDPSCAACLHRDAPPLPTPQIPVLSKSFLSPAAVSIAFPRKHVPVCVGEKGGPVERFAVRTDLLGWPAFTAQEYGYGHPGALRIPCPVADFRRLLVRL